MTTAGLRVLNSAGQMLLLNSTLVPWLLGKASVTNVGAWTKAQSSSWDYADITYSSVSGAVAGQTFEAITMPLAASDAQAIWFAPSAQGLRIFRLTGSGAAFQAPEMYVFSTAAYPTSFPAGYGLRMKSDSGVVTLNTVAARPLSFSAIFLKSLVGADVSLGSPPAKAAFILFSASKEVNTGQINSAGDLYSIVQRYAIGFRRTVRNTIECNYFQYYYGTQGDGGSFTDYYGSQNDQAVPMINAANYD